MTDLEKVISGLEHCSEDGCKGCPYEPDCTMCDGFSVLASDALELLKEQEPVKPRYEDFFGNRIARCGNCNGYIVRYKYCPGCGHMVAG